MKLFHSHDEAEWEVHVTDGEDYLAYCGIDTKALHEIDLSDEDIPDDAVIGICMGCGIELVRRGLIEPVGIGIAVLKEPRFDPRLN